MLGKLLKYDFMAVKRTMLPMYAVLLAVTLLLKIFISGFMDFVDQYTPGGAFIQIAFVLLILTFIGMIVAVSVVTFVLILKRFYQNIYGDEGYLMNTLPVTASQNLWAKLINGSIWSYISFLVSVLAVFIAIVDGSVIHELSLAFAEIPELWQEVPNEYRATFVSCSFLTLLCLLLSPFSNLLGLYVSIAIGYSANKHKVGFSVLAWIGIMWACGIMGQFMSMPFAREIAEFETSSGPSMEFMSTYMLKLMSLSFVWSLVLMAIMFFVTKLFMERKLNLE